MKSKKEKIWLIAVMIWMAVIFCMSAAPADDSSEMSLSVGKFLGTVFVPGFRAWSETRQLSFAQSINFVVRKCAHASEYAALGVLVYGWLRRTVQLSVRHPAALCVAFCFLYACTDEIHQIFVPGRASRFTDVLIDTAGALCGTAVYFLVSQIWRKCRRGSSSQPGCV